MKKQKHLYRLSQWQSIFFMMLFICLLTMVSCGKEELSQDAMDINQYILSLEYSPEELLNFQNTSSGNTDRKVVSMNNSSTNPVKGEYMVCEETKYQLDKNFDKFDRFNALRATTIKSGPRWTKTAQHGLLSNPTTKDLLKEDQRKERSRAFDLLDALSKSGGLTLKGCTLHIVVAATHCFDLDLLNTVVQDNINPIDRVEASGLIIGSTIFQMPAADLVRPAHTARIAAAQLSDAATTSLPANNQ